MAKILIKGGRVWDGVTFSYKDILTDGEIIADISDNITEKADIVFDATGKTVSAGLVDMHVHIRGISCNAFGTQGECSCFPFGVTAAADGGASLGDEALLDTFMLKMLVFVSVEIRDGEPIFDEALENMKKYGRRLVGVKVYYDASSGKKFGIDALEKICEFAHERGLIVMVHCSGSPTDMASILDTLGKGDVLTHAFHGGKHNAAEDGYASMRRAMERGVIIDVGYAGYVHTDFKVLGGALDCGIVPDVISTDITRLSAFIRGGRYGITMCMSIARSLGMSEEDIFRAVTTAPAAALGMSDKWGCLKVGGTADIAILDYTNETYDLTDISGNRITSDIGYRCAVTIADGEIVYVD